MKKRKDIIDKELAQAEKEILLEKYKTALKKTQLINEIKGGLGDEIKKNPSKAKFIKKTWFQKFVAAIKKIFTKF